MIQVTLLLMIQPFHLSGDFSQLPNCRTPSQTSEAQTLAPSSGTYSDHHPTQLGNAVYLL